MLQLILGRAGSGKTEYAFKLINELVENGEENVLLIIPEQFSFECEKRLLRDLGEENMNKVDFFSFTRLSHEISKIYGFNNLPSLSKGAKAVVFKKAIDSVKDELLIFGNSNDNNAFVSSMIRVYDEMKSCRVSVEDIVNASENTEHVLLSQKLHDISVIMATYDELIKDNYYDSASELTRLYDKLVKVEYFKDKVVVIDSFTGFVAQEYKIIEVILKQAKAVYVTFCTDSNDNKSIYDLFSYVNSNISILTDVASKAGVKIEEPIALGNIKRFKSDDLSILEKNAYSISKTTFEERPQDITIYKAKNIYDECDNVSSNISKLLRQGVKASNIAVICRDLGKYKRQLEFSFNKFNIPYFNDERQNISSQPLIMFVNFLLRVAMYSFRSDDIFSLLKTGLTPIERESISNLENYAFVWKISGSKWKSEFVNSPKGFVDKISSNDQIRLDEINDTRAYVVEKLEKFVMSARKKNAKEICKSIYYTLIDFSVDEQLKHLAISLDKNGKSAMALEQERIWDLLMEILDNLALVGGEEQMSVKEFYSLFNLMISCEDLGTLPAGLDNVQLGSADRIRCNNPYAVFIVGANEGEFPQKVSSSGLLSESDRAELVGFDFKLYSYGEKLSAQERFFAYNAMCSPTNKLYVSYRCGENSEFPSSIVDEIKNIFPNVSIYSSDNALSIESLESKANAFDILATSYGDNSTFTQSLKKYFSTQDEYASRLNALDKSFSNEPVAIDNKELSQKLFKKDMNLSATRVETFYKCAFKYFCQYGLNARKIRKAEMDPIQTGLVIHYVLEKIIDEVGSDKLSVLEESEIEVLVDKYLKKYLTSKMGDSQEFSSRLKYQFVRLSKMVCFIVVRLRDEFVQSDFKARAFELGIGNGDNGEPVKSKVIDLGDGGSVQVMGSIDRVDTFTKDNTQYVRVVDYKSGTKKFKLCDILNGLNLQMFIYLFSLCESDNELAGVNAGVLYLHSKREIYNVSRHSVEKEIDKKNTDAFRMIGVVLNDEENEIAKHMEKELEGKYIPVKYKKDALSGDIVSLADMGRISVKIDGLLREMGLKLHNGEIDQNPATNDSCEDFCKKCDFFDVCRNRREVFPRNIIDVDNVETLQILKGESADEC